MARRTVALVTGALALALAIPASSQEITAPYLTVDEAPDGAAVKAGDRFEGTEFSNTRPIADGAVGPAAAYFADDGFGCVWTTAQASATTGWIGVARRGTTEAEGTDLCPGFQTKLARASAAGAGALIVVNFAPDAPSGLGAGPVPGMVIGNEGGDKLIAALEAGAPGSVRTTFEALDPDTGLPAGTIAPTAVSSMQATAGEGTVTVGGSVLFRGQPQLPVGSDPAGDAFGGVVPPEAGYDLLGASIGEPDPSTGDLRFRLRLTGLPPSGGLPEVARYIWDFGLDKAGMEQPKLLSVEGRFTNVIRGQSQNVPDFILRGNCITENNVTTCENLGALQATLNPFAATITVTVPRAILEDQLGSSLAGARIVPAAICEGISAKASAYFSACGGAAGPATGDSIAQDPEADVYAFASRRVQVGIVPSGEPAAYTTAATVGPSSFSASLDTASLPPGTYDVHVRACYGSNCGTATREITL